jgi:hypothetical protein
MVAFVDIFKLRTALPLKLLIWPLRQLLNLPYALAGHKPKAVKNDGFALASTRSVPGLY